MKIKLYFLLVFLVFSCSNKNEKINLPQKNKLQEKIKRNINFISDSIANYIKFNPKVILDTFTRSKIKLVRYELKNGINKWVLNSEFYKSGKLKEKGLYLNGWSFGKWYKYDKKGNIISETDHSIGKKIKGKVLNFNELFRKYKGKSDSLLIERFGIIFFNKHIRFNAEKSHWYTSSNSGSFLEQRKSKPREYLLRYSIVENDTLIFTTIELRFEKKSNYKIQIEKGIPNIKYDFKINYKKANEIAIKNGFGIEKHNNEFSEREYLSLFYNKEEQSYFWSISNIPKTLYSETLEGKIRKGIGKSMRINCLNGEIKIGEYGGSIIYD